MTSARALIVDDDETILRVVSAYLKRNDKYEVLTASSPQEALEIVKKSPVDLLITDIMMPGILGTRLFQEIKQTSPNTGCILISGYEKDMYNLPSDMLFLKKPFGADELFSAIRKVIAL
jgi:two-component system cell cycle sensor histidine kinase/response regulator CckA